MEKEAFDIIIQGGQSNAVGYGLGDAEYKFIPNERILYLNDTSAQFSGETGISESDPQQPFVAMEARERTVKGISYGDFALSFADSYIKNGLLAPDRKLLIIKTAVGGTAFILKQWGLQNQLHLRLIDMARFALEQNPKNRIVGFLWHQGESDAERSNPPEQYKQQLTDMLKDVRKNFGEEIPYIAGDFINDWKSKNLSKCEPIVEVIREVVQESGNAEFVETTGLLSNDQKIGNGDPIHFCRESLYEFGERYFKAFQKCNEGKCCC